MKILFEDTIPFGRDYFSTLGEAVAYSWQSLTPDDLVDVDILAVRSTTKVNGDLLRKASKLRLVATATAGTNHLDTAYLASAGIPWYSAAGCNAVAVAEYVLSVLLHAHAKGKLQLPGATIGIVGAGNVGTALAQRLGPLGANVRLCDPPLALKGDSRSFVTLEEILQCDVVSLHVPYVKTGDFATGNMIGSQALTQLGSHQLLINACRGEVVDEAALYNAFSAHRAPVTVLDVFNNEPDIDSSLLSHLWFATPHIAGHTIEGKVRGTQMVYERLCELAGQPPTLALNQFLPTPAPITLTTADVAGADALSVLRKVFFSVYDISDDDKQFRLRMAESNQFAAMRKAYGVRHECSAYTVNVPDGTDSSVYSLLTALGFTVSYH